MAPIDRSINDFGFQIRLTAAEAKPKRVRLTAHASAIHASNQRAPPPLAFALLAEVPPPSGDPCGRKFATIDAHPYPSFLVASLGRITCPPEGPHSFPPMQAPASKGFGGFETKAGLRAPRVLRSGTWAAARGAARHVHRPLVLTLTNSGHPTHPFTHAPTQGTKPT